MGTNYYTIENYCDKCKRSETIHLGKNSYGWTFSFQYNGGKYYKNMAELKKWLKGKKIENEYGENVSNKEFWKMVEEKQKVKTNLNHTEEVGRTGTDFLIDGYSFSDCEFS